MIKTKLFISLIFLTLSHFAWGQDGIFWSFEIKFKIDTNNIESPEQFMDLDIIVEDKYFHSRTNNKIAKYNSVTSEYTILLNYGDVGGNSQVQYVWCPDIYMQINLEYDAGNNKKRKFFKLIPVYFENAQGSRQKYDLGTIQLSKFLNWEYEGGIIKVPYQILQVKTDKSISYKGAGDYEPRIMNKLVKLELQDEN